MFIEPGREMTTKAPLGAKSFAAPKGAWDLIDSSGYKHHAPNGAQILCLCNRASLNARLLSHCQGCFHS